MRDSANNGSKAGAGGKSADMLKDLLSLLEHRSRRRAALLLTLALFGAVAEAVGIGAVLPFIGVLSNPGLVTDNAIASAVYTWSGAPTVEHFVLLCGLALLAVFYIKNAYLALLYYLQARFVSDHESRLACRLFSAYLHGSYAVRLNRNSSDRIRLITAEVGRIANGFLMPVLVVTTEGMVILGIAALLLWAQPMVALFAMVLVGGVGLLLQRAFKRKLALYRDERIKSNKAMYKWASEGLGALKETKVCGCEDYFVRRFGENSRSYAGATRVFTVLNLMPRLAVETLAVTALLMAVIIGLATDQPMGEMVPLLTLFGLAAVRLMPSATRIMGAVNNLRFYAPSVREVAADLRDLDACRPAPSSLVSSAAAGYREFMELMIRNLSFRYPGSERDSLKKVNVRIVRGEFLGLIGRSGSGKTTLADILLGLLEPQSGETLMDGVPIPPLTGRARGLVGLVPQHFFLLDDTIRRNVAFGRDDAEIDDARVWRALELARLADKVRTLPRRLGEVVREQGAILSGGERQRLAIARALYDDPAILVLDEATSALDSATEAELVELLRGLAATKAIILITHRHLSMAVCDRIILLQEGRVAAEGTYAELTVRNPELFELEPGQEKPGMSA